MSKLNTAVPEASVAIAKNKRVRDFIYIDGQRLHSLSAQLFQGLSERISREIINESSSQDAQHAPLRGSRAETGTLEASKQVESGILHDFLYTRLENAIQKSLVDCNLNEDVSLLETRLENCPFVRVTGKVQINDYQRMREIFLNFVELDVAIKHVGSYRASQELKAAISTEYNKDKKKVLQNKLAALTMKGIMERSIESGDTPDPQFMQNLAQFIQTFNPDGFEILISPPENLSVKYRGVVDKKWLRQDPSILRAMYQGQPSGHWTMVGQVAGVSKSKNKDSDEAASNTAELAVDVSPNGSMGSALRKLSVLSYELERMFFTHDSSGVEVAVAPLAIYFERDITVSE